MTNIMPGDGSGDRHRVEMMAIRCIKAGVFGLVAILAATPAVAQDAEWTVQVYTGVQESPHSVVSGEDEFGTPFRFTAGWEGNSFEMPPYYGIRALRGTSGSDWSFGVEFTHAKVYADAQTLGSSGFSTLEFTDGLNVLTANAQRAVPLTERVTGHAGLGLGIAVPHVEVTTPGGAETRGYQLTGPAARWYVGASYAFSENWSAFAEYNGTYSMNEAELQGGGTLDSNILTNALNVGIGFSF